jgi:uncharacterized protein (DUF1778 family)
MRKTKAGTVGARVTPEELRRVELAAEAEGLSLSDYLRAVLIPAATERLARLATERRERAA